MPMESSIKIILILHFFPKCNIKLICFRSIIACCDIHDVQSLEYFSPGICSDNPLCLLEAAAADVTVMIQVMCFSEVFVKIYIFKPASFGKSRATIRDIMRYDEQIPYFLKFDLQK